MGEFGESECDKKEKAQQRMKRTVEIREKKAFGQEGWTWVTKPPYLGGRCGCGTLHRDKETIYEAIWKKYGPNWEDYVHNSKRNPSVSDTVPADPS